MLTNLASYLLGYLGEPTRVNRVENVAPERASHQNSDDDSWLFVESGQLSYLSFLVISL